MDDRKKIEEYKERIAYLSDRPKIEIIEESVWDSGRQDSRIIRHERNNEEEIQSLRNAIELAEARIAFNEKRAREKLKIEDEKKKRKEEEKKEEIERIKKFNEDEKKRKKLDDQAKKDRHDLLIKDIKKIYKSKSVFNRLHLKILGQGPKWNLVEQFTNEELQFIVDFGAGRTLQQERSNKNLENSGVSRTKKEVKNSNWYRFTVLLRDKNRVKNKVKIEQDLYNNPAYFGHRR